MPVERGDARKGMRAERILWRKRNRQFATLACLLISINSYTHQSVTIQSLSNATADTHECPSSIRRTECRDPARRFVSSLGLQDKSLAVHQIRLETLALSQESGLASTTRATDMGKRILGILLREIGNNSHCPMRSGGRGRRAMESWRRLSR